MKNYTLNYTWSGRRATFRPLSNAVKIREMGLDLKYVDGYANEHDRLLYNAQRTCNILHTKQIEACISCAFVRRDYIWLSTAT